MRIQGCGDKLSATLDGAGQPLSQNPSGYFPPIPERASRINRKLE